jgi:hypothetical protein
MRGILIAACLLGACAVLVGCEDEYNPMDKECGYPGNGCWDPEGTPPEPSCNTGYLCDTLRKGEPLAEGRCPSTHGVCATCGSVDEGCWPPEEGKTQGTCTDAKLVCNAKRKNEPVGRDVCPSTYGVCELATPKQDSGPTPDGPTPTPDGPTPDGTPGEPTTDGPVPDAAPAG